MVWAAPSIPDGVDAGQQSSEQCAMHVATKRQRRHERSFTLFIYINQWFKNGAQAF
jgi:tryptophan synthase alpha subunit